MDLQSLYSKSVFFAETYSGHNFKSSAEILKGYISGNCWLKVSALGMTLYGTDTKGNVRITKNFIKFEKLICRGEQTVSVNIQNFYKMLKGCKKKNVITFIIESFDCTNMVVSIKGILTHLPITRGRVVEFNDYVGYDDKQPCVIPSETFQNVCKELNLSQAKEVKITQLSNGSLEFAAGFESMFTKQATIGFKRITSYYEPLRAPQQQKASKDNKTTKGKTSKKPLKSAKTKRELDDSEYVIQFPVFSQNYNIKDIIKLTKSATMSKTLDVYFAQNLPLKITYDIDTIGGSIVFINSKEQISEKDLGNAHDIEYIPEDI